ncbi:MAG: DUF5683 domain-containing protein [Bacteroidales bacterium]
MRRSLIILFLFLIAFAGATPSIYAQIKEGTDEYFVNDSVPLVVKEYDAASEEITADNPPMFIPDPMKAVWYAALIPGGGQIYNRKYWKLPIIYGGFLGLAYGYNWNQRYYKGYANAYRDLVEDNPNKSYLDYVRPGFDVSNPSNKTWLEGALKRRKDSYRRNRDLCIISMLGVYLLSMVDAYVDASLYHFDISPDISMKLQPAIIEPNTFHSTSLGLQCAIKF